MAFLSSLGLNLRLADIDENLKSHPAALSWPLSGGGSSAASRSHGLVSDAMYFAFNEVFESGDTFKAISPGSGIYMPLDSSSGPYAAFTVSKCRLSKTIELEWHSMSLLQSLAIAMPSPFDFPSVLASYPLLKSHLEYLETISPAHPTTAEFRLLVRDLLLDRALFAGIGTEVYRSQGLLGLEQLHDMHQRSVDAGLDDIDACFSLGLLPDVVTDEYLEGLVSNFTRLALAGDLAALRELCEPVVRSGEIQWQSNPDLLLELLNRGRLDIYHYILDLASRTRDVSSDGQGGSRSPLKDITNDPFHVAIQLGHVEQVDSFLKQGATFLGLYEGDETCTGTVLAPLSAAAFWGQPEIARLILRYNVLSEGAQQAAAIAYSNNDEELMQILLSSGAISPPTTCLANDAAESLAGLSIMDQSLEMPRKAAQGFGIEEQKHITTAIFDDTGPPDRSNATPGRSKPRPPKEPIRPKERRRRRHLLGRHLVSGMGSLCSQLRDVCSCSAHSELRDFGQDYLYESGVWHRGLDVFRGLMQDSPPSGLDQVIDALLVANAACLAFHKDDGSLLMQFYNDLHRWRAVLPGPSHVLFDELASGMWAFVPGPDATSDAEAVDVPRFQGLVQSLLSLETRKEDVLSRSSAAGARLSAVHRFFERQEGRTEVAGAQAIPGRSQSRQHSLGASSTQQDDFAWSDFLNMDSFEDTIAGQSETSVSNHWGRALSSTLMLLASVAFSIILSLIIGLHSSSSTRIVQVMAVNSPGFARSCVLLTEYLAMHGVSTRTQESVTPAPFTSVIPPSPAYGLNPGLTPASSFSSLSTAGMRRNVSSSSISSIGSTTAAPTPSRPPSRDNHQPRGSRLTCPVPQCTKTFSSVSNRNKHVRDGCAFNREKRPGYPCRNAPCARVVTTSWYRETHERERCRFRRSSD